MNRERTDWMGVAFGIALACLVAFQQFKLPPVLPVLLADYHWDRTLAGALMAIYAVAGLLFSIPIGGALQRGGIFHLLLAALGLLLLGDLVTLAWPAQGVLVLGARGLEGVAFAVGAIAGPALANRSAAPRHIGLVVGFTAAWIPIGQLLATGLALILPGWRALWLAAAAATCLVALWSLALQRRGVLAAPAAAARHPIQATAQQRRLLYLTAGIFLLWSMQYFAYMTWLPQYLVEVAGLSPAAAAAGYALPVAVLLAFNIATGILLGTGMPLGVLLVGALISQAAVWWLIPFTQSPLAGIVSLVVYGIGAGVTPTCLFALPAMVLGRAGAPTAFGIVMTGRNIGVFLGPVLLAELTKNLGGWGAAWPMFGTSSLAAVAAAGALATMLRRSAAA
jgi:predicted MFS family arabinose efflux permease